MQRVFLNVPGAREHAVPAFFEEIERTWHFELPHNPRASETDALQYLQGFKRYSLRGDRAAVLMTHAVVSGEAVPVEWDTFKRDTEEHLARLAYLSLCCSVCCEDFAHVHDSLRDLQEDRNEQILIASPCGHDDHAVCTHCLKKTVLNFYSHPVTKTKPMLGCIHDGCDTMATYDLTDFHWLLEDDEFSQLLDHLKQVLIPDLLSVQCAGCSTTLQLENTNARANRPVSLLCASCHMTTCWQCTSLRDYCMCMHPGYGGTFNRFYRPSSNNKRTLLRNYELTMEICLPYLETLLATPTEPLSMECPCCHALVQKSVACNEMAHCGRKWCYLCGEMALQNETFMCDHYGYQCPRYEETLFWKLEMGCDQYACQEGICYDETDDCCLDAHAKGRCQKNVRHRQRWFDAAIESTPFRLRNALLTTLCTKYPYHPLLL